MSFGEDLIPGTASAMLAFPSTNTSSIYLSQHVAGNTNGQHKNHAMDKSISHQEQTRKLSNPKYDI